MKAEALQTLTITEAVVAALRSDLLSCRLLPGERLSIKELAKLHNASPGAVREALSRLSAEGLVMAEAQRGFRAAPISVSDLVQVTDARILVEAHCVRQSIERADDAWESNLVSAMHQLAKVEERAESASSRSDDWSLIHVRFHESLTANCPNNYLLSMRASLAALAGRYHQLSIRIDRSQRDALGEHRAIAEAALSRDADLTSALLARHLRRTMEILTSAPELRALSGNGAVPQDIDRLLLNG